MNSPSSHIAFSFALLAALLLGAATAAAQNELVPASNAVKLERVWTREGEQSGDQYGYNVWGGVDLSGDSIADFAIYRGKSLDNAWFFYKGGNPPDTVPFIVRRSYSGITPVVGDFFGDGHLTMVFVRGRSEVINETTYFFYGVRLYAFTNPGLADEPYDTTELRALLQVYAGELDGEPGDELVLVDKFDGSDQSGRILIYKGGVEFQLDSPTVIIYDSGSAVNNAPSNWQVCFSDFDGDGRIDMVMGGSYPTGGPMLRFYWGDDNSPWSWAEGPPDRDLPLIHGQVGINSIVGMGIYDLNGDGAADIGSYEYEDFAGSRIYLSGNGKNARDRTFFIEDADFYTPAPLAWGDLGYINDSSERYATAGFTGNHSGWSALLNVSGSSYGPDHDYEAWYAATEDGLNESASAQIVAADVTGDGYEDQIHANHRYRGDFVRLNSGIAIVLKGGPHIPFDDTTLSVAEYPVAGESGGLYLWPNPVADELHIAWKGNLKVKPSRFAVYDLLGREVVSGDVDPHRGAAVWRCGSVAAGTYTIVAYDAAGGAIASARIVKR